MSHPRSGLDPDPDPDWGPDASGSDASGRFLDTERCLLPVSPAAPQLARAFVRARVRPEHLVDPDNALLLVSELVTDAVVHGEGPIVLTVRCVENRTIIAVTDGGAGLPVIPAQAPGADALAGRGLWMLVVLAGDWGIRANADTKTIWFAIADQPANGALERTTRVDPRLGVVRSA